MDSNDGAYVGEILAVGLAGGGISNYGAAYQGVEATLNGVEGITLVEGGIGPEVLDIAGLGAVVGGYGQASGEVGVFFGVHEGIIGEHGSIGIGFSLGKWKWLHDLIQERASQPCSPSGE